MKRFRVKLIGFGCAVLAGTAVGADDPWQPASQPATARVSPAPVTRPVEPVQPRVVVSTPIAAPPPAPTATVIQPTWQPITPRVGLDATATQPSVLQLPPTRTLPQPNAVESLPPATVIPNPPAPAAAIPIPNADETPRVYSVQDQPERMQPPTQPPREFLNPPKTPDMVLPIPPDGPRQMLPQPQPLNQPNPQPDNGELPVAPADLMVPAGAVVPGQHGTFGSKPINISRDFPTFWAEGLRERMGLRAAGGPGGYYGTNNRGFVQAEYLLWWASPLNIPLLGTTNTQGGFGFLGEPGTAPIIGPGQIISPFRTGMRVRAGTWLGDNGCGVDGSFFYLAKKTNDIVVTSDQFGIITRPVFSPNPAQGGGVIGNTGEAVTVPGILTGSLAVHAESVIYGWDANIRKCLGTCCDRHAEWFFGFRNVDMEESVSITENINVVGNGAGRVSITDPIGSVVKVRDSFAANNYFFGGQIGGLYERSWGRFSITGRGSVALGVTHEEINIQGVQIRTQPGKSPQLFRGGLLAAGPNLGQFYRDEFSVVPELTINMGYRVSRGLRLYTGYNLLYWSNVVRPGDQIDGVVDLSNVPNAPPVTPSGLSRPRVPFRQSDMWISGVQFGAEFRW